MKRRRPPGRKMPAGWARTKRLVIARDKGICGLCHKPGADSADHIIPKSKGGTEDPWNLQAAHHECNQKKNARTNVFVSPRRSRWN